MDTRYNESVQNVTIYIDEAGTLPDPADTVIVVAAIGIESPAAVDTLWKQVKKKPTLKKLTGGLKFYTAGEKTKHLFFELLANMDVQIAVLIVDKMGRKIPDTPQHYAALCSILLRTVQRLSPHIRELVFDRHFSRTVDLALFDEVIHAQVREDIPIRHVDSKKNTHVNVADMVAGAVLAKETGKDSRWYEMIREKITRRKRVPWNEVKKRLLNTKKLA